MNRRPTVEVFDFRHIAPKAEASNVSYSVLIGASVAGWTIAWIVVITTDVYVFLKVKIENGKLGSELPSKVHSLGAVL